jgi:hypothetical protein
MGIGVKHCSVVGFALLVCSCAAVNFNVAGTANESVPNAKASLALASPNDDARTEEFQHVAQAWVIPAADIKVEKKNPNRPDDPGLIAAITRCIVYLHGSEKELDYDYNLKYCISRQGYRY